MARFPSEINFTALTPEQKLQVLKEMGFREGVPNEHTATCGSRQGSGLCCTCHPPLTTWTAPFDVREYMGETNKARKEFAEKRWLHDNDGVGESPGLWVTHLEKTAPRWNQ